jgi:transposase
MRAVQDEPLAHPSSEELIARLATAEAALAAERAMAEVERTKAEAEKQRADRLAAEHERLLAAFKQLQLEIKILRKGIFVASAERVDTTQLELEFAAKKAELARLSTALGPSADAGADAASEPSATPPAPPPPAKGKAKPKGRRDLRALPLAEERCEIVDAELEGKADRIGWEESYQIGWRKGGPVRVVIARAKYRVADENEASPIVTAPMPPRSFGRCLAAPSLLAKIITDKYCDGLPLYRQEQRFAREGLELDRGTMCRWIEDSGMTAGCVVLAARADAFATSFCISTDATGIGIRPEPSDGKGRQPCRRGHFFVMVADRDHVLFEYVPRETSAAVRDLFRGYSGYVQADAKNTYDVLFEKPNPALAGEPVDVRHEVGCWAHARRRFYQAAIAKDRVAREGLWRIHELFELDQGWQHLPPAARKALRDERLRPQLDAFFIWAEAEYAKVKDTRGLLRSALGYVVRQRAALVRFLDDGRLRMDNNVSERELRAVAVGRKAWLWVGSDDHAQATANLFTLIASCKLHGLDPEAYLRDLFRVLCHWPKDRYLELAPRYWAATRARLDPKELALPLGHLTVPDAPTKQTATS